MNNYLIYPKQFRRVNIPVEKNRCFVIMPFRKELDCVYGMVKQGLNENGFVCNRVDEISGATPIINKILSEILKSRYIIADLTDCNANVFYELGIAHSFKDAQNKQKGTKVPFDITHLTYIEYDPNNPKYLISAILNNIKNCSSFVDFQEILNIKGIIPYVKENENYFVEYVQAEMGSEIIDLTKILTCNIKDIDEQSIDLFINKFESTLLKSIIKEDDNITEGVLKIYHEILIACSYTSTAQLHASNFLNGTFTDSFPSIEEKIKIWKTDLAVALAKSNKMIPIVMPWIIRYFSETKTATIDLNRYKLEAFLMTSEHPAVNEIICNSIFDSNCYIREHMSDIIGEKRLTQATNNLCMQLTTEENYYAAVSEIEALGKLGNPDVLQYIIKWVDEHEANILKEKQFFVLKHVRISISKLDTVSKYYLKIFDEKYSGVLDNYFIL